MQLETLTAISPIDGRYRNKLAPLAHYFSEMGFMRYRVQVEVEYFIALATAGIPALRKLGSTQFEKARRLYLDFSVEDAEKIKSIENVTNHDVKAVEYFIKERFDHLDPLLSDAREYVHFGLTSQDINNTSTPMMLRDAVEHVWVPACHLLLEKLESLAESWQNIPMLARTHGQPASPTLLSKEIHVFTHRLKGQLAALESLAYPGKFGGATGNLNAHFVAFPNTDWHAFATDFLQSRLGLQRSRPTTQIDHYDGLAAVFDNIKRINTILIDLAVDMWLYISQDYFKQKTVANEVGSSAMPHKVNPIDFENAEGNLGVANAMLEFMSRKLPVSRLQRDLTDSTVLRNVGVAMAHAYLAVLSLQKGLGKLEVNQAKIAQDLEDNWAVVAEAIQTVLRRENYPNPYEALKALTRGKGKIDAELIREFISGLDVSAHVKAELAGITPATFVGKEDRP
jgi:adenylosuccinate lyase